MAVAKSPAKRQSKKDEGQDLRSELVALRETVEHLQAQLAEQSRLIAELMAPIPANAAAVAEPKPIAAGAPAQSNGEVEPEVLLVIAAAVTAFLGKKVRIRSAKRLQTPYEIVNPWAQLGRVIIHASHTLRLR